MLIQLNDKNDTKYAYPGKHYPLGGASEHNRFYSVPHTTRPVRPGEVHGQEYYFIDFGMTHSVTMTHNYDSFYR